MGKRFRWSGVDSRAAEHTAQTIHHRLAFILPNRGPDYAGERTERASTPPPVLEQ